MTGSIDNRQRTVGRQLLKEPTRQLMRLIESRLVVAQITHPQRVIENQRRRDRIPFLPRDSRSAQCRPRQGEREQANDRTPQRQQHQVPQLQLVLVHRPPLLNESERGKHQLLHFAAHD